MLKGLDPHGATNPLERTSFRQSWTQPEGVVGAIIVECRILDTNVVNYTVDCVSIFDQRRFFDCQVGSPYLHPFAGEGFTAIPEVGAKCYICIPSDGPPPFVLAYIMPVESVPGNGNDTNPANPVDATFAGGRGKAKGGDISIRGRDGNFAILHRGGVAQFGSTELAQRIYIPLGNLVTDISETYNHFNSGGSINWGVRQISSSNPETEFKQTFRVFADDKFADIRAAIGKVQSPVPEPKGDAGSTVDMAALEITKSDPIVFEFALCQGGFDANDASPQSNAQADTKLRMIFDRAGGTMIRCEASVSLRVKKKLRIRVDDNIEVFGKKDFTMECDGVVSITGKKQLNLGTSGGVLRLNGGSKPVATVGSIVKVSITVPLAVVVSGSPGTITAGQTLTGVVSTGNSTILG